MKRAKSQSSSLPSFQSTGPRWIDITRPIDDTLLTWPGRARPKLRWEKRIADGHHCNVSFWELSAHSGTHMDAPLHFIEGGKSIDEIDTEMFVGECVVLDLTASGSAPIDENLARRHAGVKRLLVKTDHSRQGPGYAPHKPLLTRQALDRLLAGGMVLLGTDRLSVDDSRGEGLSIHRALLGAGGVILEGLSLGPVQAGPYHLLAVPLRMTRAEASPIRAFLKQA